MPGLEISVAFEQRREMILNVESDVQARLRRRDLEWRERWERIQMCTKPADRAKAQAAVTELYRNLGVAQPTFVWFDSPLALLVNITAWPRIPSNPDWPSPPVIKRSAPASYDWPTTLQPRKDMGDPMAFGLEEPTRMASVAKRWTSRPVPLRASIQPVVQVAIMDWMYINTGEQYFFWPLWVHGQHDANWVGLHHWWRDVVGASLSAEEDRILEAWIALAESSGWGYPCKHCCHLCERPERIELNEQGFLHNDHGPAVRFRDGSAVWALNGAATPEWLVMAPPERLDPRRVLEITNVQVRREFVKKLGMERICHALKAVSVDQQGDYELLLLELMETVRRPYLKMLNPSTGTWHIEGVDQSCRTVAEAIAWRNGTDVVPAILT